MLNHFFFGYGSLVNRQTHAYSTIYPARIAGWRRAWRHTSLRPVAFLTAIPCDRTTLDGLVAAVPQNNWQALDEREFAYSRQAVRHTDVTHEAPRGAEIQIYAIPEGAHSAPTDIHPILLSYLDVVVQGYLTEFGRDGADRFFATTDGWNAPILDDRAAPRYPRHQTLTRAERGYVDDHLAGIKATVFRQT